MILEMEDMEHFLSSGATLLPLVRLVLQNHNAISSLVTEIQHLRSEINEIRREHEKRVNSLNIKEDIRGYGSSMHWILFRCEVSDINDNDKGETIVDTYPLVYVKLICSNHPKDMGEKIKAFDEKIQPMVDDGKIEILISRRIYNMDGTVFIQKMNQIVDGNIRRYDRSIMPIELYLTYSIRSFVDYKYLAADKSRSVDFIHNLFHEINQK